MLSCANLLNSDQNLIEILQLLVIYYDTVVCAVGPLFLYLDIFITVIKYALKVMNFSKRL